MQTFPFLLHKCLVWKYKRNCNQSFVIRYIFHHRILKSSCILLSNIVTALRALNKAYVIIEWILLGWLKIDLKTFILFFYFFLNFSLLFLASDPILHRQNICWLERDTLYITYVCSAKKPRCFANAFAVYFHSFFSIYCCYCRCCYTNKSDRYTNSIPICTFARRLGQK